MSENSRPLSTIECTLLGLAWLRGPCTIYALMKELSLSVSSFHKSRAGTAYSVAHRLIGFGLLRLSGADEGQVEITKEGVAALRDWVAPPVPMADVAHSADLLRLRCFFLGTLTPEERHEFIQESLTSLREFLAQCEDLITENEKIGDYFGALATLSSVLETRARIQWLECIQPLMEAAPPAGEWRETLLAALAAQQGQTAQS